MQAVSLEGGDSLGGKEVGWEEVPMPSNTWVMIQELVNEEKEQWLPSGVLEL